MAGVGVGFTVEDGSLGEGVDGFVAGSEVVSCRGILDNVGTCLCLDWLLGALVSTALGAGTFPRP